MTISFKHVFFFSNAELLKIFYIVFTGDIAGIEKDIAQRKLLSAWTFITPVEMSYEDYKKQYKMEVIFFISYSCSIFYYFIIIV